MSDGTRGVISTPDGGFLHRWNSASVSEGIKAMVVSAIFLGRLICGYLSSMKMEIR